MEATSECLEGMVMVPSNILPQHLMLEVGSELGHVVMEGGRGMRGASILGGASTIENFAEKFLRCRAQPQRTISKVVIQYETRA